MKNKKILIVISILILGALSFFIISKKNSKGYHYEEVKLKRGDFDTTISTTGIVKPQNRLEVKSSVSGRVEKILVEEGDVVKKGDIIGWISSSERVALIDVAQSKGKEELKKWEDIYKPTPLIAAIDGTIISKNVEPGQTVSTADVIIIIADKLIILANVDETDVAKVKNNTEAKITLDAYPDTKITGFVKQIAYEATKADNVTVYEVKISAENPPSFMKSGMSVDVLFFVEKVKDVSYLPATSILYDEDGPYLLAGDKKQKFPIKIGRQFEQSVEVLTEIDPTTVIWERSSIDGGSKNKTGSNPFFKMGRKKK